MPAVSTSLHTHTHTHTIVSRMFSQRALEMAVDRLVCVHRIWLFQRAVSFPRARENRKNNDQYLRSTLVSMTAGIYTTYRSECLFTSLSGVHPFDIFISLDLELSLKSFLPRSCATEAATVEKGRIRRKKVAGKRRCVISGWWVNYRDLDQDSLSFSDDDLRIPRLNRLIPTSDLLLFLLSFGAGWIFRSFGMLINIDRRAEILLLIYLSEIGEQKFY